MVSSKINKEINYEENKSIDPEDNGYQSSLYEIDIGNQTIIIALGKQKYTYSNKKVVYYPIYLIDDDVIKSQIGVYELSIDRAIHVLDEDGDIDLSKFGEPLLYTFVTPTFISKIKKIDVSPSVEESNKLSENTNEIQEIDLEADENDVIRLKVLPSEMSKEKAKIEKMTKDGIFEIDTYMKQPATLKEETEDDSMKHKLEFKKSSANKWIENFMKNNQYNILENDGAGDCFFYAVRDAFKQIGKNTTVPKLRALLAREITDEVFQQHRNLYLGFQNEIDDYDREINEMKKTNIEYKKRIKKIQDKSDQERLLEQAKKLQEQYSEKTKQKKETQKLQNEYVGYMKEIDTIDKFRVYIQTSNFWADAWAISTLEHILNVKFIIFSEEAYKTGDLDSVLNCGDFNSKIESSGAFSPTHYIMTTYNGNHYELLTYNHKRILGFGEIPYDVKILTINKCLEKNSGIYYLIQDFRNFKTQLGLDPDLGKIEESEHEEHHLYDESTVFTFHSKSDTNAKPGNGSGEKIPKTKIQEYFVLSKNDNWRRKLDDSWTGGIFELEKLKWASVEHYIQGSKYKKGFPDFYKLFSMTSESDISKDVQLAKLAGESGKKKDKLLRPIEVKIDPDYHLGRMEDERKLALRAKFTQNEDLKHILLSTHNALLLQFVRRNPPKPDIALMMIRDEMSNSQK